MACFKFNSLPAVLGHGPFEAVLEFFLVLLVVGEYLLLSSVSVAPTGLSDAAWLLTELKTETKGPRLKKRECIFSI